MKYVCIAIAVACLIATAANAHICLTYPMMRGEAPDLMPGDNKCFQRTPDCGNLKKGAPKTTFIAGTPTTVTFQQNLNHWYQPKPGYFDLAVSYDGEQTWEAIGSRVSDFPANNMNTQTFFNVPVVFPRMAASAVVRARYVSHNVNEIDPANNTDAIFYSCSDIEIVAPGTNPALLKVAPKPAPQAKPIKRPARSGYGDCQAPPRFIASGAEYDAAGNPFLYHTIHYDTVSGWIRWNRNNTALGGSYDMTDLWNLTLASGGYTPQFIIGLNGPNTCSMYGGDEFRPWSFGPQNGMEYNYNYSLHGTPVMNFNIPSAGFTFDAIVLRGYCLPIQWTHNGKTVLFESIQEVSYIPKDVFAIPGECRPHVDAWPNAGCKSHMKH